MISISSAPERACEIMSYRSQAALLGNTFILELPVGVLLNFRRRVDRVLRGRERDRLIDAELERKLRRVALVAQKCDRGKSSGGRAGGEDALA